MESLVLVRLDYNYCDYLRRFDNKVPYNKDKEDLKLHLYVIFLNFY